MAIKGSLKEASLPDVLQLLAMGAKTGCLAVTDRSSFGYIYFEEGRIIYASLLNRRDRLGDILVRDGVISRKQLDKAIAKQSRARDGRRLGEILRDDGYIDQKTLQRFVRHQIEEAVYHLFTWNQGTFYFEPGQRPEKEPILVSIDPESLLLEGAHRVDEWSQIKKKVPSLELIFAVDPKRASSLSSLKLTGEQEKILPYMDGKHSVYEVIEETALGEYEVGKALYGLISAGIVRRAGQRDRDARRAEAGARAIEHRNLGVAFYKTAMFDEAVREFRRVTELQPEALDAEFYLALVAMRQGEMKAAEKRFREVLKRGGKKAGVFNNLAQVLDRQGKTSEAISVLDDGLRSAGEHPKLLLSKAVLQLKLGASDAAKATLKGYRKRVGENMASLYYSTLALAHAMSGDLEAAVRVVDEGLAKHPNSAALTNNAGVILERKGDHRRALELYERAFEKEAALPQAAKNYGDMLYRDGAYDEAAEAYERALRANPELGDDIYAKLGNVYYKSRARKKAIEMWTRALEINPANDVVRTNLDLVRGAGER